MQSLKERFGLEGKTAVVTGGGGTLCGEIAKGYAAAGANVVLWDIREDMLEKKKKEIEDACGECNVHIVKVDLFNEDEIVSGIKNTIDKFGGIDILVNGAGGNKGKGPFTDINKDDYEFVLKLNLLAGCVLPSKNLAKYWIDNKINGGTIINIASMSGFNPLSGVWAYSAAKSAVMNQTMAMAKEFAQYSIRVNAIAPGFFIADQNRKLLLNDDGTPTERGRNVLARTPMNKFGEPDDLIGATVFLASKGAKFISGVTLPVDGAYLCDNI